jgi:23S rRNA (cytidine1920-2'-O)/16S rRNA (cytidine1409-2'-O)-methyltransferase
VTRNRLDRELVRRGLVETPEDAHEAIERGRVTVSGRPGVKAETLVASSEPVAVESAGRAYASRGGDKLVAALERFGVDPSNRSCLDAGASTGGFTDVLLSRGAARVIAVDVGYGQLAWRLRTDDRVVVMERSNVRDLQPGDLPFRPDLITADLSFISLAATVPSLRRLASDDAELVLLVKPQFEAPREAVKPGGVVTDPAVWKQAIESVALVLGEIGAAAIGAMASPLPGPSGNVEFFLHARSGARAGDLRLGAAIEEGAALISAGEST